MSNKILNIVIIVLILISSILLLELRKEKNSKRVNIELYTDSINNLLRDIDDLNDSVYFKEREIENLFKRINSSEIEIVKVKDMYKSEKDRVRSLPTDSAIQYLNKRLNEE